MAKPSETSVQLFSDVNDLCRSLIKAYGLTFSEEVYSLSCPVMRWLDFRMRYIDPKPRRLVFSDMFPFPTLPAPALQAFDYIQEKIIAGADINSFQSNGIITNDTSGRKSRFRTDLLWACWGIYHFHLTSNPDSDRGDYQLFCIFDDDVCAFLDIKPHLKGEEYSAPEFVEIISRNWPHLIEKYELKTIKPDAEIMNASMLHKARRAGLNTSLAIGKKAYMQFGMGLTSACTPLRLQLIHMNINEQLKRLAALTEIEPQFTQPLKEFNIDKPKFRLAISHNQLLLYEEASMVAYNIASPTLEVELLTSYLFPQWAINNLMIAS